MTRLLFSLFNKTCKVFCLNSIENKQKFNKDFSIKTLLKANYFSHVFDLNLNLIISIKNKR